MKRSFDWDPNKAAANLEKHGIDFLDAIDIFVDPHHVRGMDDRFNYGEMREQIIGRVGTFLLSVVFTERDGFTRLISASKASSSERAIYHPD